MIGRIFAVFMLVGCLALTYYAIVSVDSTWYAIGVIVGVVLFQAIHKIYKGYYFNCSLKDRPGVTVIDLLRRR